MKQQVKQILEYGGTRRQEIQSRVNTVQERYELVLHHLSEVALSGMSCMAGSVVAGHDVSFRMLVGAVITTASIYWTKDSMYGFMDALEDLRTAHDPNARPKNESVDNEPWFLTDQQLMTPHEQNTLDAANMTDQQPVYDQPKPIYPVLPEYSDGYRSTV